MSQSGRLITNQPVPGAGIETITGNIGGAVPGDGAANIELIGAGTITVTGNIGANSLTISSTAMPATYPTDNGIAVPDAGGALSVLGGANINTDATIPNAVLVHLDDNVAITGTFQAGSNILSTAGNITATIGNIVAGGDISTATGEISGDSLLINNGILAFGGMTVDGQIQFNSLNRGVVQSGATGVIFSNEGHDGEIIIGSTIGAPAWGNIAVGRGLAIVNGHNAITMSVSDSSATAYHADAGIAVPAAGILVIAGDAVNTHSVAAGNIVTVDLNQDITVNNITANQDVAINGLLSVPNLAPVLGAGLDVTGLTTTTDLLVVAQAQMNNQLRLLGARPGILETDAGGLVSATTGANGSLLIGGGVGTVPVWNQLQSAGATIAITHPGANTINLEAIASQGANVTSFFARQTVDTGYITGDNSGNYAYLGAAIAMSTAPADCFNTGGNFYIGDGAGNEARYTAPLAGTYFFDFQVKCYRASGFNQIMKMRINNTTQGITYDTGIYGLYTLTGGRYEGTQQYCVYIHLNAGDVVTFGILLTGATVINNTGVAGNQSFISGHKVA